MAARILAWQRAFYAVAQAWSAQPWAPQGLPGAVVKRPHTFKCYCFYSNQRLIHKRQRPIWPKTHAICAIARRKRRSDSANSTLPMSASASSEGQTTARPAPR